MADTITLKREFDALKRNIELATRDKGALNSKVADLRVKVSTYKRDYESALTKAEGYKKDYDRVQAEFETKVNELKLIDEKLQKDSREIIEITRNLDRLTEEMKRMQSNAANTNSAPSSYGKRAA